MEAVLKEEITSTQKKIVTKRASSLILANNGPIQGHVTSQQ
jgi:hypothetical protein